MTTPTPRKPITKANSAPRTTARLAAVQALYEMEVAGKTGHEVVPRFVARGFAGALDQEDATPADPHFFEQLVLGVADEMPALDRLLSDSLTPEGHLARLEVVLRAIMRLGAYELVAMTDVPARVVITEYVQLAEAFFSNREPALVNGVLDRLARDVRAGEMASAATPPLDTATNGEPGT
ncbi:MAG: transcription antitermination factor NusB [Alphaproteobacteria bacterium]|nr:transcription antitermination factor NusB [Alphaproteobacteria bacterium]